MKLQSNLCLIVIWIISIISISASMDVTIANLGIVRGRTSTIDGISVDVFKGIPFAKPPVGNLRFVAPVKVAPWSGVKNATIPNIFCPQSEIITRAFIGVEDCLYLNIYRPSGASTGLPVMVWIHGGGYVYGSGSSYNGEVLAAKYNVTVVTINYRLGVLGFFNVPGTSIKGNYGLLDQIMALKWVKSNIASFSGDPTKVTIFGESAGAGSVSLLMVSPLAKGLFSRAIAQSGSATCAWAIYNEKNQSFSKKYASKLGCDGSIETLATCLRGKGWMEMLKHQQEMLFELRPIAGPSVDNDVIKEFPLDQLRAGTLPTSSVELLTGFNKDEGTMFVPALPAWNQTIFETNIKGVIKWEFKANTSNVLAAVSHIYPQYQQSSEYLKYAAGFGDFIADFQFIKCGVNFAEAWSNTSTYLYEYTYPPTYPAWPNLLVSHALEVDLVFGKPFLPSGSPYKTSYFFKNFTSSDKNVSANLMSMWVNFAKTGNPGNNWPKYDAQKKQYLRINLHNTIQSSPRPKAMAFWNKYIPRLLKLTSKLCPEDKVGKASNKHLSMVFHGMCIGVIFLLL